MTHMRFIIFTVIGIVATGGILYRYLDVPQQKTEMTTVVQIEHQDNQGKWFKYFTFPLGNYTEIHQNDTNDIQKTDYLESTVSVMVDENALVKIDGVTMTRACADKIYNFELIKNKKESHTVSCFGKQERYSLIHTIQHNS